MRTEEDADVAALITADADATMAADVITDVDVTVDGVFPVSYTHLDVYKRQIP